MVNYYPNWPIKNTNLIFHIEPTISGIYFVASKKYDKIKEEIYRELLLDFSIEFISVDHRFSQSGKIKNIYTVKIDNKIFSNTFWNILTIIRNKGKIITSIYNRVFKRKYRISFADCIKSIYMAQNKDIEVSWR